jgi:hypothetical protein
MKKFTLLALIITSIISSKELCVISLFRNEANYLKEWIEYHKLIGVDHFRLYDNGSIDDWQSVLKPYMDSGLVEVIDWQNKATVDQGTLFSYNFIGDQLTACRDGIKNEVGKSKWVALIDLDEFLVPMRDYKLTKCLDKYFSNVSAIYVNWRNFGTSGVTIPKGQPIAPKLIECSLKSHSRNGIGKTILRPEDCDYERMHYPHHALLFPGKHYVNGHGGKLIHDEGHLKLDGVHYDKYLRINHYALRDEDYFQNVRIKRNNHGYGGNELFYEHHQSFSLTRDKRILRILQYYRKGR